MTEGRYDRVFVEIRQYAGDGKPDLMVKRMGPLRRHDAERVDDGANINLNHDRYYTLIVEAEDSPSPSPEITHERE